MTKYLEELGVKEDAVVDSRLYPEEKDEKRSKRFEEQRKEYGFDERETWSLSYTHACWLYSHIMMFIEIGGETIDYTFHHFDVEIDGKTQNLSQLECMNIILKYLKEYIIHENEVVEDFDEHANREEKIYEHLIKAYEIYSKIDWQMWW